MIKLLRADLSRMFKSKPFWVCVILSAALSVLNCVTLSAGWEEHTSRLILSGGSNSILFMAIFTPLFVGTDYSHGTIRNKLIVGAKRPSIYFSNLLTVIVGDLLIAVAAYLPKVITAFFGESFGMGADEFAACMIISLCAYIAVSAIFAMLGMLIASRSRNIAITIVATFLLVIGAAVILDVLNAPEYVSDFIVTVDGIQQSDPMPNPGYIPPGAKREILTTITDILPMGQMIQMELGELHNQNVMPLYSLGVLTLASAAGIAIFRRKDLK